ncbi:PASTA domain-containing protein [Conexibacter sp. CPCC 206217]|uniref:PASTA domain-containing protein n=1 Tax=Conexibacter sp. CPCC 206217 TaxID=3064574 RepID=UPI0027255025|nr:PASTA domain-containing protein [Conexibacter sp. CPCC 206217]MDO8214100.1 PASTA domain-containing protein [Conexibacter sp. CPCC 206217]
MLRSLLVSAVCAVPVLSLAAATTVRAQEPAPAPVTTPVDWRLDQAGRDALSLDLTTFGSNSCFPGNLTATAVESRSRIRLTVAVTLAPQQICTADYAPVPLVARLAAPVRGRLVVGPRQLPARSRLLPPAPARDPMRVPRITGLAPVDALAVVRQHGFTPAVERVADLRGNPRVIGQTPASGRRARSRAFVTLFVSR